MAKTVLIIDDDPVVVRLLSRVLGRRGYATLTAFDGDQGLRKVRQHRPDLITLDVMMPELNGYSVCSFLKSDPDFSDIPIIMITSREEEHDSRFEDRFAPDAFFNKPFNIRNILRKIEELIYQ